MNMRDILIYFHLTSNGDFFKVYNKLQNKEKVNQDEFNEIMANVDRDAFMTILDKDYPESFKEMPYPPIVYKKDEYNNAQAETYVRGLLNGAY